MRNYDYWKKKKQTYNNEIILVLSGIFYRTFDADARVLSDCFWFKIKQTWGYEGVWFPKSVLGKYLSQLQEKDFWYKVYEKNTDNIFEVIRENKWWKILSYDKHNLTYLDSYNGKEPHKETYIQNFLNDLEKLIVKYRN